MRALASTTLLAVCLSLGCEDAPPARAPELSETTDREATPPPEPEEEAAEGLDAPPPGEPPDTPVEEMSPPELEAACFHGNPAACDLLGH